MFELHGVPQMCRTQAGLAKETARIDVTRERGTRYEKRTTL